MKIFIKITSILHFEEEYSIFDKKQTSLTKFVPLDFMACSLFANK